VRTVRRVGEQLRLAFPLRRNFRQFHHFVALIIITMIKILLTAIVVVGLAFVACVSAAANATRPVSGPLDVIIYDRKIYAAGYV
jgi:ABC-type multidrug transport system permease subunit